ncbi:MAG: hypothetical protein R2729_19990 [Bryobacteraceae bacterium]
MKQSDELVYSNDPCSAFIAAIVGSYESQIGSGHYLGRTAMQKLVYFARAVGVPIPCKFEIYTYGPYSETVTFAVDSLLADDVIRDMSKDPRSYSDYRLGENAQELLGAYGRLIEPSRTKIDAVVKNLGRFSPQILELVATLHFAFHRLKGICQRDPSKEDVISEFQRVKKDKFAEAEISSWYEALRRASLI